VRYALGRGEPYRRWLLVFDNAHRPEEIEDLIPTVSGDVLITSRNHRWAARGAALPRVLRPGADPARTRSRLTIRSRRSFVTS
jgi:hypothetical protein